MTVNLSEHSVLAQRWGNPGLLHKSGNLPSSYEFPLQTSVSGNSQTTVTNMISRLAVEFLNSPKKYHQKDIFTFHFLKAPSSKPLPSVKKTTPLILFQREKIRYNKKLQQFLQNRKEQPWLQRPDWGGHSAAKQSVGGEAAQLVLLNTEGTKSPFLSWRSKWAGSQIRDHLTPQTNQGWHLGNPRAVQAAAAINMQIKLYMHYGLAGCLHIHTLSA